MAQKLYLVDIDLAKNELVRAVLHNSTEHPVTPRDGQVYYNTIDNIVYARINNAWVNLGQTYTHPTINPPVSPLTLSGNRVLATLEMNAEGHVTEAATRVMTLSDLGYTGDTDANNYVHPEYREGELVGAPLTQGWVISDVETNESGHVINFTKRELTAEDIGAAVINDAAINLTQTWSSDKINSELDDLVDLISGALIYKGGYDAQENLPDLESGTGVLQGYTYVVTREGDFFTEGVQPGDMLISTVDSPTTLNQWTRVNKNIPDIENATQAIIGVSRFGTQTEVNAGVLDNVGVSPKTLKEWSNGAFPITGYTTTIGGGSTTTFTVTHSLDSKNVLVQAFKNTTGEEVGVLATRTTDNAITVSVNEPLTTDELRIVVKKI